MRRILLTLRFDGTRYAGWQVQQNAPTVQQTLQDAAEAVLKHRPGMTGCSRTDSGVHALAFCCHFDTPAGIPLDRIPPAFNSRLPRDIVVTAAREVPPDFHARYDCTAKTYLYKMYRAEHRDPFLDSYALRIPLRPSPDIDRMRAAAALLCTTADFSAFCAAGSSVTDRVRTVYECELTEDGPLLTLRIRGNGFLYNMVRIIAGTLLEFGRKAVAPEHMLEILESKDRGRAGPTAPAKALYLAGAEYPF